MYIYVTNSFFHCINSGLAASEGMLGPSVLVPNYFLLHNKLLVYNHYISF